MNDFDKRFSRIKNIADNTVFLNLKVTDNLKNRVKSNLTKSTVRRKSSIPLTITKYRKQFTGIAALLIIGILLYTFLPGGSVQAVALTINPLDSSSLYSIRITKPEDLELLDLEIDSCNALYYCWSPNGRYLAYGNDGDIFLYDRKNKKTKKLTNTPDRWELMPSWSPDSEYLAFTSRSLDPREGKATKQGADPWVMQGVWGGSPTLIHIDGSGYKVLEEGTVIDPPSWSPDGNMIAYGVNGSIHLFTLTDQKITVIKPSDYNLNATYLGAPSWSPARNELAVFFSLDDQEPTREEIINNSTATTSQGYALLDLDIGKALFLYEYEALFISRPPALWSSDGNNLALVFKQETLIQNPMGLFVVGRSGGNAQKVGDAYQAAWEPGGTRLAYIDSNDSRFLQILSPSENDWNQQTINYREFLQGFAWQPVLK